MKATVEIVKVTPTMAEKFLQTQVKEQRGLRNNHVKTLAQDMVAGEFRLSADALVIIKGALANGQHRMWAVIESDTTQPFLIMTTDDEELYKVLDCGLRRTAGDAAHVNNSTAICAVAMLVIGYHGNKLTQFGYVKKPSRIELIEFVQKNDEKLQQANAFMSSLTVKNHNLAPKTVGAVMIELCRPLYGERILEFLSNVYTGNAPGTASQDLRDRLIRVRLEKGKYATQYYLALFIKAFNSFVAGSRATVLRVQDKENYPQLIKPGKK